MKDTITKCPKKINPQNHDQKLHNDHKIERNDHKIESGCSGLAHTWMDLDWAPADKYNIYIPCFVLQCSVLCRWSLVQEKDCSS